MPFTFSHPAITLPVALLPKRFYSLTGLIAGSIIPDFEYFIRFKTYSEYSHTVPGIFWFDLPLAIFFSFVFHFFVRDVFIASLPQWFSSRFSQLQSFDWKLHFRKNYFVILLCMLIGIFSHLFWDSWTHEFGYFVRKFPVLQSELLLAGYKIPMFHILQHSNTLIGAIVILLVIRKMPVSENAGRFNFRFWLLVLLVTIAVLGIGALTGKNYWLYGELFITGISGGLIGILIASLLERIRQKDA